ncbi:deoR-like helix-turn-helix domain protein [Anoxybacillus sp. B7M1]|jgi:DeoR family transcriptional regulator, fructose operon transcriptional repressor|uniref:DeoR/GlpR family DNA-binding transcription regulator n=1 Tax=Anoxybacillaceae TaxID=3120669 RepID=UPI0005CCD387|nr:MULTISPECIES: DeoR/GlpR family DNA-binding transcription regulator [Anoxybacillus]ANB56791.1 deoR-like helix-turn-helix domain protein [Anoxybacillus sp. B2M1]ANB63544.1 deoR-like helix-turn-helix domain protein [Anoxybacillus sp. B7M1]MBB3908532.1 DeoR/GlpR family transcriptional regulator of sugar metabolism [Anoxybacillus rupiensis]OQM44684.1 DeoR family transcriptional regulator [Anoxybacillus sp. UARK-01]
MLAAERQQKIVEIVNERLSIRVSELSKIFSVTEETIRRDLEKLEKEHKLKRSHGGAISIREETEIDVSEREITNVEEKKAIAQEAIKHIESGDRIILDASTTAWYLAKTLPDIPLTVITNSIKVAVELSKKGKIQVISTGGMLLPKSLSYVGPLAERSLDAYHVDKVFLSCKGVHLANGLSESNEWQALLKKRMMEIADKIILMADSSKFGIRTFVHMASLADMDHIITDDQIDHETKWELEEQNLSFTVVAPLSLKA